MKHRTILLSSLLMLSSNVLALPDLSEPNDIVNVGNNNIEIINTQDNSILECEDIGGKLQGCKTTTVTGLVSPFRAVVARGEIGYPRVFITKKNSSEFYWIPISQLTNKIPTNTAATKINTPAEDETSENILDIQSSPLLTISGNQFLQRFYFSKTPTNSHNNLGQFGFFNLNLSVLKNQYIVNSWFTDPEIHIPAFELEPSENRGESEPLYGIGHLGTLPNQLNQLRPIGGNLLSSTGHFDSNTSLGNTSLDSDVASIAKVDDKFWITYKSNKKFTRFDSFPSGDKVNEDSYHAPSNANVTLRKIISAYGNPIKVFTNYFAVFADDNKVGDCTGASDFICIDAFRYLNVTLSMDDYNDVPAQSLTTNSLSDHGVLIFHNLNYSPLNANEISRHIVIPDSLASAFSGSCLDKVDFSAKRDADEDGNDTCTLNFDFRNLHSFTPIQESFDVGFSVDGSFDPVQTNFHFNIDLPSSVANFRFTQNGQSLSNLVLNAGDSGTLNVDYSSNIVGQHSQPQISFLKNGLNDATFQGFFENTGCLAANPPALSDGEHCTLTYHIPAGINDGNYSLKLANSDDVPAALSHLSVNVSARGYVVPTLLNIPQEHSAVDIVQGINLQPGGSAYLRFRNVGGELAHNVITLISQPDQDPPIIYSGSCTSKINLVTDGYCILVLQIDSRATAIGRYHIQIRGDDITSYDLPITVGELPAYKRLGVTDSNTGLYGQVSLSQDSSGYINITNYANYPISNLMINLPELTLSSSSSQNEAHIFYQNSDDPLSCTKNSDREYSASLNKFESCRLYYRVNGQVTTVPQDAMIHFSYQSQSGEAQEEYQSLHFTNQPTLRVSFDKVGVGLSHIKLDASTPETTLVISNDQNYALKNLNISLSESRIASILSENNCPSKLDAGKSCSLKLSLDDEHPFLGNYQLVIHADNLRSETVPISIEQAPTDQVQIDNRGGYAMYVGYTNYHANKNADDSSCHFGACYAKSYTGSYTNPFDSHITGVSGRDIEMHMILGTSVTLHSCDGGKIICTGTTLNPYCRYYGTDHPSKQNQCLMYNSNSSSR
ncbi:hypothetical protein D5018_12330 [Parashewanella curva]|uniref:Uncharacterized protein n=1 Tax=Parashewanella curva TaxID=2338552 RepID=A0A3L8PXR2_9GAMM|nr:hypothetical protein [Parashewanella curva]RLV59413.1 hypothetical protein D5018_12330 [Parashewanella curva]